MTIDEALETLADSTWTFGRHYKKLPETQIRELLGRDGDDWPLVFLRLAVPLDADVPVAWARALQTFLDLNLTYAWGSKQRKERFGALAKDPEILAAIQGTAANCDDVPLDMLAVLVTDGSDASIDALVRHIDPALVHQDRRLDRLTRLRVHAANKPNVQALLRELEQTKSARNRASPALELLRLIGLEPDKELWFQATIWSRENYTGGIPRVQAHVAIDSRKARWMAISVAAGDSPDLEHTSFTNAESHIDELKLGVCNAEAIPDWLARAAKKLRVTWDAPHLRASVRGAKRDQIARWLVATPPRRRTGGTRTDTRR